MQIPKTRKRHYFTPLRYPGGKTTLADFFDLVLKENRLNNAVYIEPYAGGAGAAVSLLLMERVRAIAINDLDESIFSFWKCVVDHSDELMARIAETPVTISEWRKQFEIFRDPHADILQRGFATFFLNRTNRSGILSGGPIGGLKQDGKWKIDARFNKSSLIEKIGLISLYKDRISVINKDGLDVIHEFAGIPNTFFYIDPPYFEKGSSLYMNAYKADDHLRLAELLNSLSSTKWILSYDNVEPIQALYAERMKQFEVSLHYQAHSRRHGSELMIISDVLSLPASTLG